MSTTTSSVTEKEGYLRKRTGRYHRWSVRYFNVIGSKINYKVSHDVTTLKGSFDLVPGCIVTDIIEESNGTIKGKKIFVFWLVWPHDKNSKPTEEKDDSDDDDKQKSIEKSSEKTSTEKTQSKSIRDLKDTSKSIKEIVEGEVNQVKKQQKQVEEQLERHHAHDKTVAFGAKVGVAAVGAVVVGTLTAGIGLIPYLAVVGVVAVAGGGGAGVAFNYTKPSDSRLILGAETMSEALAWKQFIEQQVALMEFNPKLPSSLDPLIISNILAISAGKRTWKTIDNIEGVRISELVDAEAGTRCMKAQKVFRHTPFSLFLALMDGKCWPKVGNMKVVRTISDHADVLEVEVSVPCSTSPLQDCFLAVREAAGSAVTTAKATTWRFYLNRFWKLTDNGVYLMALNHTPAPAEQGATDTGHIEVALDAVITISPRRDHHEYDNDFAESLVQISLQCSSLPAEALTRALLLDFLRQHLVEFDNGLMLTKFQSSEGRVGGSMSSPVAVAVPVSPPHSERERPVVMPSNKSPIRERTNSTADARTLSRSESSDLEPPVVTVPDHVQKKRFVFRRALSTEKAVEKQPEPVAAALRTLKPLPENTPPAPISSSSSSSSKTLAARSSKNRPLSVNTAAAHLRAQIASKEYLMQRMEKEKQLSKSDNHQLLMSMQADDLTCLKAEYQRVIGSAYDQAREESKPRSNRQLLRWGSNSSNSNKDVAVAVATTAVEARPAAISAPQQEALPVLLPAHWLRPIRRLRCRLVPAVDANSATTRDFQHWEHSSYAAERSQHRQHSDSQVVAFVLLTIAAAIGLSFLISSATKEDLAPLADMIATRFFR